MHIPDGFISAEIWAPLILVSAAVIFLALRKTNKKLSEKQVPLMGVLAAFVFAAQMINFPIAGGTSGHFLGGALCAILLGPFTATIVMSSVFIVQSLVFQDGGILALGANIFNMGIVGIFSGYWIFECLGRILKGRLVQLSFASAYISVLLAAAVCSLELAFSGTSALFVVLPAMLGVHALIGIGEGVVTSGVLAYIQKTRPDLLKLKKV